MYLFWRISFWQTGLSGVKKTTRHGEKMSKSHDRLCRSEICFLRVGSVDDNGIAKLRKVVTDGSVEGDFPLLN